MKKMYFGFLTIICLLFSLVSNAQTNLYVDASIVSSGNGTSWNTAYKNLNQALNTANAGSGKYNINIAQGSYYPTSINGSIATSRDSSFVISRKGISILGGYPAGGGTRNSKQFVTRISGDIGTQGTTTDNLYHVLLLAINSNSSDSLKVDGVNVEGGYANGSGSATINSVTFLKTTGGGIYVNNSSGSTIQNVYLTNCLVQNNYASSDGGGMENFNCTLNMQGCFFYNNSSGNYGAGLNNEAGGSLILVNDIFSNNNGGSFGGALRVSGSSTNYVINCTFVNNSSGTGGGIRVASAGTATVNVYNSVFRGNHSGADYTSTNADISNGATLNVYTSNLQSSQSCSGCLTANTDPSLSNINNPLGSDGFFGTADDGLKLTSSSPCINTGTNSIVSSYSTDIAGATRVQSSTVDMGAYEFGAFVSVVTQGSFGALNACSGSPLSFNSFLVSGTSLTNDIDITAPSGFEVSTSSNSGYAGSISITTSNGSVSSQTIYVRLTSSASGYTSGDITISSTGATTQTLAVNGTGFDTSITPAVVLNDSPTGLVVSGTSVTFTATTTTGGSNPIYNFKINGSSVQNGTSATYSTSSLHSGDIVTCELTANNICQTSSNAISNDITMSICNNTSSVTNISICLGDSVTFNGNVYKTQGSYSDHFTNATGCDSTATLNLTVKHPTTSSTTTSACDSLVWNGTTYSTSGTYIWSATNAAGCDSTATLNLTINNSSVSSTSVTACDSLVWNGVKYTISGVYTFSTTNAVGCDSTATLNLTINNSTTSSSTVTVCDSLIWNSTIYRNSGTYTYHTINAVGCDSTATLILTVNNKPFVDSIVGLTNIEILAIGAGGGAGGPDGAVGAGGGAGGAVYGKYTLPATGSNIYTIGVGGGGGYGQGCAGNAAGGIAGANGGGTGGNAGTGGCSGGGGGGGGWSGFYQGSTYYVVAGGGAGGGGSNEGTANDIATPGGGNQSIANGTSMTGQNGTAYSGDGGGGGAGGGGFYGGAGQSSLNQTNLTTSQAWGGANYANPTNRNAFATYVGNNGALSGGGGTGGQGTTSTITNSSNFNYSNTYGKGGNAQGNGGTATTANGNNGVVIIRYQGSPVATGGTVTQSGGYTLHTFTTAGSNTFRANSATAVCVGSTTSLSCATPNGVWSSSDTTIATIDASTGMVTGITPGVITITYTVTSAQGCVGKSTKQFTVNPLPTVPAITGNTTICDNTTTTLSNTLTGGVWSSSNAAKATVNGASGLVSGVAAGTSTITYLYTDNNGCSNTNSTVITINASPTVAAITGNAGVCIGSTTTFSNVTLNGTWSSSNTNVATINNSGLISTVATGSSTISYTVINANVCTTFVTKSITVNALPNVTANATATTVCFGTQTTLTGGNASSYTWNNGVTNNVAFAPAATNTYTVTGTDGNGCVKTANITITVNSLPTVSISPSVTTLCNGYSSTLTASGASTYGWTIVGSSPYLDQVSSTSTLKLAAGLHKLKSSYSGAAIRIRRSSDNTEADFGFSGNDLDVSAISTFIGAGTAYVKTLYDQSGNGNHLSQTSTGNQPTLTLSGLNGKPVIHTNTSQNIYNTTNFTPPFSVVYAARQTGGSRGRLLSGTSNNWLLGWWGGNRGMAHFDGWITSSCCSASDNNVYVYSGTGTGSSSQAYQNKTSITTNPTGGTTGPNGISLNRNEASDADFTDVVEFNSVLSTADRNIVENGIGAYYGLSGFYNTTGAVTTVYPNTTTNYTVYGTDGNGCIGTAIQTINVNPKPNAGNDITNACGGSTQTLTGTANTGTWTALSTNPTGATLSSTTAGVATVSFVNAASGTYSYIYTLPTTDCSDTMNIIVGAKPNAGADINSVCGGNIISLTGAPNTGTWSAMGSNPTTATSLFSVGASLLARYDASVTSSFTQSSGVVTTWNDLSGNGYHLTQSSTGPTLTTINGVQAFDFNSAKRMTNASVPLTQNVTVLMSIKYNSAIATWGNFMCHGQHDLDWSMRHNSDASNSVGFHTNNDNSVLLSTLVNGNTYILVGRLTQNGNGTNLVESWVYNLDGSVVLKNATLATTISAGNKTVFVGSSDIGSEASNAKIGEILYYNSSLSSNDLTNAVNYLKDKWFSANTVGGFTQTSGVATVTYPNAATGTYNYIYTTPFGCTDTASVFITPKPNAGNDINYLCGGATQVLNGTTTNGTWTAMSTNPTGASLGSTTSGSASVTFDNLASGVYNYIYTLPTNCSDTMSITVRPKPNAGADQAVCILNVATGVTLTSNVTGVWSAKSGNAGTSNIVSASTASTQVNNFSVIGDYNYINTNNGCTDTVKVTVTPAGSIGNYVWKDQNNDGLQNEPTSNGVNGITVELYKKDGMGAFNLYTSTTTANNVSGNPGYYNFGICEDGVYKIKAPTVNPFTQTHLTAQDATANTDGNSDVNPADGFSPEITIDTHGSGVAKDNNTIDVGYQICTKPIAGSDFTSCGGQLVAITGVSTTPALPTTEGNWSALGSNPSGATLGSTILGVATIQFDSLASGVYSFIYTVTGGCDDTLNITVGAKPSAGGDLYEVCGGSILTVTGAPVGGTWSQASANESGATVGSTSNGAAIVSFDNLVSGTYTFIYTTPFGCTDTMTISTKPKPNAGSDVYMECGTPRLVDSVRATPTGGTWTAMAGNPTGITLGSSANGKAQISLPVAPVQGTWSFIYTAPNGCTDTMKYTIGVTGTPAPAINSGTSPICGNSTVQICPTQFGWSNYQWYKNGVAVSGINGTQACITVDTSKVGSYTLAGTNGSACWSKQSPAVVVSLAGPVTPTITVQGGSTTACNNGSITLISSSQNNNQWNKDGVAINGATSQYFTASTSGVYTVTTTNCGYTRTSTGVTVTIVSYINIASIQASSGSVCTGSTLTLSNTTTGGVWSSSNPSKAAVNASTGVVSGIAVGSTTITYTVSISGCSNSVSYYLNVVDGGNIPIPTIAAQSSTTICGAGTVQLCASNYGWSNYQWYRDGVAVALNGTGSCITVDTSKLGSYTLTATTGGGCWSAQSSAIAIGLPALPVTPIITTTGTTSVCNGATITLTSSSSTNNQWKKDGVIISGATSQTYTATSSGVYTVSVTNCAGSTTSAGTTLTIVPHITVNAIQSSTSSVCKNSSTTLTNTTSGGVWSSSNLSKATVNASTGVVTGVDTGSVTITYTVTVSGCSNSVSITLTIVDGSNITAPIIAAQSSASICSNGSVKICPTTFGWSNYQWYKDGVAVALNGTSSCITADTSKLGSYTLAATNGSGCWSPQSNAIVVSTATTPAIPTISGAASTCNGQTVQLTSSSSTNNQWKKDGVTISGATNQSYTTTASGVYTVTVTNACGGSATSVGASVSIGAYITVNSIQSVTGIVCKNATQTLINTTPNGVWTSNNTSVGTVNPTTGLMTGIDTGTVTITYTVTVGGCSNFAAATFTVVDGSNIVPPTIVAQGSTSICSNGSVTLCPTTFGWSNYQWYKNGVLVSQNGAGACVTVDTSKLGTYTLSGTTGTGCWSSQSNAIVVSAATAPATPTVSLSGSTTICNGASVVLTSSASTGNQWNKDGVAISGATSQNYTASASGVYTVTVTNCGGSTTSAGTTITVAAPITVASITASSNTACMGSTVTLSNATSGGVWSSSADTIATVSASGVVTPIKAGSLVISYTVTVGACSKTVTYNLTVPTGGAVAAPILDVRGATAICGTTVLQICPATYGWSNYQWYKNGVAIAAPTGTAACINIDTAMLGNYTLAGTNGFGCWSAQSIAVPVTLAPAPATPTVSLSGSATICNGASSVLTSSAATSNQWYKDGVAIGGATGQTYAATTSGVYKVAVTSNCGSSLSSGVTITVAAPINVASITNSGSATVCFGNNVSLSCVTSGGVWSSSNAAIATVNASGVVTTVSAGTVTISYTVTSGTCTGVSTYTLVVQNGTVTTPVIAATGGATTGSTAICGSGSLQMCPQSWGYSNYQWYKDGVAYSTSACITVSTAGSYTLTGTNGSGCWSAQSSPAVVTINPIPTMVATTGPTAVCAGSTITLVNSSTIPSGGTGIWTTGYTSQVSVGATTGIVSGLNAGNVVIKYTVTSAVGCTNYINNNVTINAIPSVPSITYAPGTVNPQAGAPTGSFCANRTFTIVGTPSGGVWSKTGPINVTTPGGVVTTGSVAGSGSIKYTYTDVNGCVNSRTMVGNVYVCAARGVTTNEKLETTNEFLMYPNPAKSEVKINVETLVGTGNIVVTDLYGKVVKSQTLSMGTNTINTSKLSVGMYFVSVITSEGKTTKKLVVE